ncbi:MAG: hypothetical protein AB7S26_37380 [Sandaracinaceae bacterium]
MPRLSTALITCLLLGTLATGCVVSPQPEPPGLAGLSFRQDELEGAPDTVPTGDGTAFFWALFTADEAVTSPVNRDGSFGPVPFTAPLMDSWVRTEVRLGETRSRPIDFMRDGERAVPVVFPIACVTAETEVDAGEIPVGETTRVEVVLRNDCEVQIVIGSDFTTLRFEDRGIVLDAPALPVEIPAGGSRSFLVDITPTAPGLVLDILSLDVRRDPDRDRRFVTVVGRAR